MLLDRCLSICPVCSVLSVTLVCCGQTVGRVKIKRGMQVDLGPGHIVLDGDPAPPPQKRARAPPPILAHVCCGQTAGCIKMPLGTKVGLGPGRIVLHEDQAPPLKRGTAPNFLPMSIVAKRSPISSTVEHLFVICDTAIYDNLNN